jgi:hypothetical protein
MEQSLQLRLQHQPEALKHLLSGLNNETAKQRPIPEKWSVAENIAHLGRYHEIFLGRLQRIISENDPLFERYVADNDPGFLEWCKPDFDTLLKKFHESRKLLNNYLLSLSEEEVTRTARHPFFGRWTVNGWCEFFLLHENHHYFTILKLLPQIKVPAK